MERSEPTSSQPTMEDRTAVVRAVLDSTWPEDVQHEACQEMYLKRHGERRYFDLSLLPEMLQIGRPELLRALGVPELLSKRERREDFLFHLGNAWVTASKAEDHSQRVAVVQALAETQTDEHTNQLAWRKQVLKTVQERALADPLTSPQEIEGLLALLPVRPQDVEMLLEGVVSRNVELMRRDRPADAETMAVVLNAVAALRPIDPEKWHPLVPTPDFLQMLLDRLPRETAPPDQAVDRDQSWIKLWHHACGEASGQSLAVLRAHRPPPPHWCDGAFGAAALLRAAVAGNAPGLAWLLEQNAANGCSDVAAVNAALQEVRCRDSQLNRPIPPHTTFLSHVLRAMNHVPPEQAEEILDGLLKAGLPTNVATGEPSLLVLAFTADQVRSLLRYGATTETLDESGRPKSVLASLFRVPRWNTSAEHLEILNALVQNGARMDTPEILDAALFSYRNRDTGPMTWLGNHGVTAAQQFLRSFPSDSPPTPTFVFPVFPVDFRPRRRRP